MNTENRSKPQNLTTALAAILEPLLMMATVQEIFVISDARHIASLPVTLIVFCGIYCSSWTINNNSIFFLYVTHFSTVNPITYLFYSNTLLQIFDVHFHVLTSSVPSSPTFTCSVCRMFCYSSASFSDNDTCNRLVRLQACLKDKNLDDSELTASKFRQN